MSRPSQTEGAYVQTVPDGKCLCPDFRAFTRPSCVHVQTFVRSPDFRAFMSRLSCAHQTFVRSCPDFRAFMSWFSCVRQTFVRSPDFRAFTRLSCVYVQTFVRSPDFRAFMSRLSCVHQNFVRSCPELSCVRQTFVRSPDFRAFIRHSCVHQTFVRSSPDFNAIIRFLCDHSRLLWLKCGAYPPKKSTIGLKFTILCPKQCSVIEKVKPYVKQLRLVVIRNMLDDCKTNSANWANPLLW